MNGNKVKAIRTQLGMTQEELAEKAELSVISINRIENNKTKTLDADTAVKVALALGLSTDYLFDLSENPTGSGFNLTPREMLLITAWRRGDKITAAKAVLND